VAKWRPVDVRVWSDRKFLSLSERGRMLWLYLLTSPFMLPIPGVLVSGEMAIAEQLGWTTKGLGEGFGEVLGKGLGVSRFERLIWLRNALDYQPIQGPNHISAIVKSWDDVPDCDLKIEIWQALVIACKGWSKLFTKGLPEPLTKPLGNPVQDPFHTVSVSGSVSGTGSVEPPIPPSRGARSRAARKPPATESEENAYQRVMAKLRDASGIDYQDCDDHRSYVIGRLRDGIHELELRAVVAFCADKWEGNPDMVDYLRPKTLFGPRKIYDYLDAARTRYRADLDREMAKLEPQPKLELVK
jgi:uncharacterized phage protein (TIGR02220 family)